MTLNKDTFTGEYQYSLDSKGSVNIPAKFRQSLSKKNQNTLLWWPLRNRHGTTTSLAAQPSKPCLGATRTLNMTVSAKYQGTCHMENSIQSLFDAIWSTPCGHYFLPYGVLHIIVIHVNCGRNGKSSPRLVFNALWSTPYGLELLPYGVLHMALLWCHMEFFTVNS